MTCTDNRFLSRSVNPAGALSLALVLLAIPAGGSAADDSALELYLSVDQTEGVKPKQVVVRVDGRELQLPGATGGPEAPLLEAPLTAGPHAVDVEILLDGHSSFFTYLDEYRFRLRGHLDLEARRGEVSAVKGSVLRKTGFLVPWESQYRLELSATSYPSGRWAGVPAETTVPSAAPPAAVAPAPPAPQEAALTRATPPAAAPAQPPAAPATCALEAVLFDFDQAALTARSTQALDRFATCLGQVTRAVRLEGHSDVRGDAEYNRLLGERRAEAVATYLGSRGVAAARLSTRSWGTSRPLCAEATEACYARNRRVEAVPAD